MISTASIVQEVQLIDCTTKVDKKNLHLIQEKNRYCLLNLQSEYPFTEDMLLEDQTLPLLQDLMRQV